MNFLDCQRIDAKRQSHFVNGPRLFACASAPRKWLTARYRSALEVRADA